MTDGVGQPRTASTALRAYTPKQMGDACEMLIAAELTLAGNPALKAPDYWPGCDVMVQRPGHTMQRVSVKSRSFKRGAAFVEYRATDVFDWLAIVILHSAPGPIGRQIFLVPRSFADAEARKNNPAAKTADARYWRIDEVATKLARFENNFSLALS